MEFKIVYAAEWSSDYKCPKCTQVFTVSDDSDWHFRPRQCLCCGYVAESK